MSSINSGLAPFAAAFKPVSALDALAGKDLAGTWKLRVSDIIPPDTGTVQSSCVAKLGT